MAYEQKPGDIIIFKNQSDNPKAPQYTGNGLDLDGNPIRISLWLKDGVKGKFMAGRIEPPFDREGKKSQGSFPGVGNGNRSRMNAEPDIDDIPF